MIQKKPFSVHILAVLLLVFWGVTPMGHGQDTVITKKEGVVLKGASVGRPGNRMVNKGDITGYGHFNAKSITNKGRMIFQKGTSVVNSPFKNLNYVEIIHDRAFFKKSVINQGIFKTTDTEVTFDSSYTEQGAYISDPSVNYFMDLIIGPTGYLIGGFGDWFVIRGDLISSSAMPAGWDTKNAGIEFKTGLDSNHDFYITAEDKGPLMTGYDHNFSWYRFVISPGNTVRLVEANIEPTGALYAGQVEGAVISGSEVTNLSGEDGIHIYYMAQLPGNAYLNGAVFSLQGSGRLIPVWEKNPDFDHDGDVDSHDLLLLSKAMNDACSPLDACPCDLDNDRLVDAKDLVQFAAAFGTDPSGY